MRVFLRVIEYIELFFSIFSILCKIVSKMSLIRKESESMKNSKLIKEALSDLDLYFEDLKDKVKKASFSREVIENE